MGDFLFKKEWLSIIDEQEEKLVFDSFSQNDAWSIGKNIIELMDGRYKQFGVGIAAQIYYDNTLIFQMLQDGTSICNIWWLQKKLNVAYKVPCSTLKTGVEIETGLKPKPFWYADTDKYAAVGGCIPIKLRNGGIVGYAAASNLAPECDHQLAADAIAITLGVSVPSVW